MDNQGLSPFAWLGDQGQDVETAVEINSEMLAAQQAELMEFANLVNRVLGDGEGTELVQRLRDLTIEMPLYHVTGSLVTGEVNLSPSEWAAAREGQNSIIRFLESQINMARNPINMEDNQNG